MKQLEKFKAKECAKCKNIFATQSERGKCVFCGSTSGEILFSHKDPYLIKEWITRKKAEHLYEEE